jgi:hypothetical protein
VTKRGARVPAPATGTQWHLRFASKSAAQKWEALCNAAAGNCAAMHAQLSKDPRQAQNPSRHHRLKGALATAMHAGQQLEQWQYEITGAGRVWFLIDDAKHTVRLVLVEQGHPSKTDK